jgi:hypothetical protein
MNQDDFFINYIKEKIETVHSRKFKLNRHYMHIQTFGQDGAYHTDDYGDNKYTFCLYISEISTEDLSIADGDFVLKIPGEKIVCSIETHMNRGVLFPSEYIHKGMAYRSMFPQKRLCITWKLEELSC